MTYIESLASSKITDITKSVAKEMAGRPLSLGGVNQLLRVIFSDNLDEARISISELPGNAYCSGKGEVFLGFIGGLRREIYADLAARILSVRAEMIADHGEQQDL